MSSSLFCRFLCAVVTVVAMAITASLPGLARAQSAAPNALDYAVMTPSKQGVTVLRDNDFLESGSKFRLEVTAHDKGKLTVSFRAGDGITTDLISNRDVSPGQTLRLPGRDQWFRLDEKTGTERLIIRFSGKTHQTVTHRIRHVEKGFVKAPKLFGSGLATRGGGSGKGAAMPTKDASAASVGAAENLLASGETVPDAATAERFVSNTAKIRAGEKIATRGNAEIQLYRRLSPGVVLIVAGLEKGEDDLSSGSGSVISRDGSILTNWHVVGDSEAVAVFFKPPKGKSITLDDAYVGRVEKVDEVADLALIKLVDPPKSLRVLRLGDLKTVEVGADVHAIGHPHGEDWTYTKGIVSQIRSDYEWRGREGPTHKATIVQTQTPLNPGNSGGPLFNDNHQIIGVNSFIASDGQGLNYAVSVNDVKTFLEAPWGRKAPEQTAKRPQQTPQAARKPKSNQSGACEPRSKTGDIYKKNGVDDTLAIDKDCDGRFERIFVDEDENGTFDFVLLDTDGDGKYETEARDTNQDGKADVWLFDKDLDGTYDIAGFDDDQDGEIDRYKQLG